MGKEGRAGGKTGGRVSGKKGREGGRVGGRVTSGMFREMQ